MAGYSRLELRTAVARGDWATLIAARVSGVPWNRLVGADGMTALHAAVLSAPDVVVEHFVAREAPLDWYYTAGGRAMSPWLDAAARRRDTCCALMVESGMALDALPPGQPTPFLLHAFRQILPKTLKALTWRGEWLGGLDAAVQAECLAGLARLADPGHRPEIPMSDRVAFIQVLAGSGWMPHMEALRAFDEAMPAARASEAGAAMARLSGQWQAVAMARSEPRAAGGAARRRG